MMEKTQHPHTIVLALTYDDTTQANRDAARMFQYRDVQLLMYRLRDAIKYRQKGGYVRFICAGEQGDRNGRCHWHLVLYSSFDLTQLGEARAMVNGQKQLVTSREDIMSEGETAKRISWSLWPHGFTTFQQPDQNGMKYVLSYCLKDQFTQEKSKGTMRETRAENFSTGLFRMSKRPAIGETWLRKKMEGLAIKGAVLPSLNLKIPEFSGFYHPSGSFRQKVLWSLSAINQKVRFETGVDAPQFVPLLATIENPKEREILNGPEKEDLENLTTVEADLERRQREAGGLYARRELARTCGNALPCENCLSALAESDLKSLGVERFSEFGAIYHRSAPGFYDLHARQRAYTGKSNPYCQKRGSKISRETFPDTDRTNLERPSKNGL